MASQRNGTLYTGATSDLARSAGEHRDGCIPGFVAQYGCRLLVWYEHYDAMTDAIAREKQIKGGTRRAKLALMEALNLQSRFLLRPCLTGLSRTSDKVPSIARWVV